MHESDIIERLIATNEYDALTKLSPNFNLFDLLDDALREPAWSRIFCGLLDSTLPHGLGESGFREWLKLVDREVGNNGMTLPVAFRRLPSGSIFRTSCEYSTPAGRRLDILVRVLDRKHRIIGAVGIENKLESPEQPSQVCDYQAALCEVFPQAHRLIIYLTPDGRKPTTADPLSKCPYVSVSYRTMVENCRTLESNAQPRVAALLESLAEEIESTVLGDTKMKAQAKSLIAKLWADPTHRQALRLIAECIPTPRKLWETGLIKQIAQQTRSFGLVLNLENEELSVFYPSKNASPQEIKLWYGGDISNHASHLGFSLCYMLHCSDRNPDVGSEFSVRLMAWCDSAKARQRLKKIGLEEALPPSGRRRNWSTWENIWTGGSYILQDLDSADLKGMTKLAVDAARQTYSVVANKIAGFAK